MHIKNRNGKYSYEVNTAVDALQCLTIIETHAEEGAWDNQDYIMAANGLDRWLQRLVNEEG